MSLREIAEVTGHTAAAILRGIEKADSYLRDLFRRHEETHVPVLHPVFGPAHLTPSKMVDGNAHCSRCCDGELLRNLDVCGYCHRTIPSIQRRLNAQLNRDEVAESLQEINWQLTKAS